MLGVGFDALTLSESAQPPARCWTPTAEAAVITANPEIVLRCQHDADYAAAVNSGSLVLADEDRGISMPAVFLGSPLPERVAGADLVPFAARALWRAGEAAFSSMAAPRTWRAAPRRPWRGSIRVFVSPAWKTVY